MAARPSTSLPPSSSAEASYALTLLVDAQLAKAIIGPGGSAVRRLKAESGVHSIHLSSNVPGAVGNGTFVFAPLGGVAASRRGLSARELSARRGARVRSHALIIQR